MEKIRKISENEVISFLCLLIWYVLFLTLLKCLDLFLEVTFNLQCIYELCLKWRDN